MTDLQPVVSVVDDEPGVRAYLAALLMARDYRVIALASVEELLEHGALEGPGCLILDIFLPGLNGLDAQQILMDTFRHLPIIFISGQGSIPMSVRLLIADDHEVIRTGLAALLQGSDMEIVAQPHGKNLKAFGDRRTDVLVLSAETALACAPQYGSTPEEELLLYVIHGVLHLVGYDDTTAKARTKMRKMEKHYLTNSFPRGASD